MLDQELNLGLDPLFQSSKNLSWNILRGQVIVLEGLIGVGKSTAGRSLTRYLNQQGLAAQFFPEFFHAPLLELYINNMASEAWSFQSIMVRERIRIYHDAHRLAQQGTIAIIDRSIPGDIAFAQLQRESGYISPQQWQVYHSLITREKVVEPSLILYLNCSAKEAYRRMQERAIKAEVNGYSLDYFERLEQSYQSIFSQFKIKPEYIAWEEPLSLVDNVESYLSDQVCQQMIDQISRLLLQK